MPRYFPPRVNLVWSFLRNHKLFSFVIIWASWHGQWHGLSGARWVTAASQACLRSWTLCLSLYLVPGHKQSGLPQQRGYLVHSLFLPLQAQWYIFEKVKAEGFTGNEYARLRCDVMVPKKMVGRIIGELCPYVLILSVSTSSLSLSLPSYSHSLYLLILFISTSFSSCLSFPLIDLLLFCSVSTFNFLDLCFSLSLSLSFPLLLLPSPSLSLPLLPSSSLSLSFPFPLPLFLFLSPISSRLPLPLPLPFPLPFPLSSSPTQLPYSILPHLSTSMFALLVPTITFLASSVCPSLPQYAPRSLSVPFPMYLSVLISAHPSVSPSSYQPIISHNRDVHHFCYRRFTNLHLSGLTYAAVVKILSCLSMKDRCQTARVCRLWRAASRDISLFSSLSVWLCSICNWVLAVLPGFTAPSPPPHTAINRHSLSAILCLRYVHLCLSFSWEILMWNLQFNPIK